MLQCVAGSSCSCSNQYQHLAFTTSKTVYMQHAIIATSDQSRWLANA